MTTTEQIFKTKLIERLEQDHKLAKLRRECFEEGTNEYTFNKATMIQISSTLFDIKDIEKSFKRDAQLIASAPELLKVLQIVQEYFIKTDGACDHRITQAINKAIEL